MVANLKAYDFEKTFCFVEITVGIAMPFDNV